MHPWWNCSPFYWCASEGSQCERTHHRAHVINGHGVKPALCSAGLSTLRGQHQAQLQLQQHKEAPSTRLPAQAAWRGQPLPSVSPSAPRPVPSPQLALCWEWAHALLPALGHHCSPSKLISMVSRLGCRVVKNSALRSSHSIYQMLFN